jgi:hypothetical protein
MSRESRMGCVTSDTCGDESRNHVWDVPRNSREGSCCLSFFQLRHVWQPLQLLTFTAYKRLTNYRFDDIKYFHDIPKERDGGSILIMKEELPDPAEWWEMYQKELEEQKANKNKSGSQVFIKVFNS